MKRAFLIFLLFLGIYSVKAQPKTITLKAGSSLQAFKTEYIYQYPGFRTSKVLYKDGVVTSARLNYNQINGKMEFINPQNDTLVIINNEDIKAFVMGDTTVYCDKASYFQLVIENPYIKLGSQNTLKLIDKKRDGGMGTASSTSAIDSYKYVPGNFNFKLALNIDHVFSRETRYYFSGPTVDFVPASKKNLLIIMADKKEAITRYLNRTQVDFNKKEHLVDLLNYIKTL